MKIDILTRKLAVLIVLCTLFHPSNLQSSQQRTKRAQHRAHVACRKRNKKECMKAVQARTQRKQQGPKKRQVPQRSATRRQVQRTGMSQRTVAPQRLGRSARLIDTDKVVKEVNKSTISTVFGGNVTTFTGQIIEEKDKIIVKIQYGKEINDSRFKEKNVKMETDFYFTEFHGYKTPDLFDLQWQAKTSINDYLGDDVRTTSSDTKISLALYRPEKRFGHSVMAPIDHCMFDLKTYRDVDLSQASVSFSKKDRCFTITIPYAKEKRK